MQKMIIYAVTVFVIVGITGLCLAFTAQTNNDNIEFLKSYGWKVKREAIEKVEITIPEVFDEVWENYNLLQKEAGLDLKNYCGRKGIRYTYEVTNYPEKIEDAVRANIIVIGNEVVGGDIMTVRLDGFMHSLKYK